MSKERQKGTGYEVFLLDTFISRVFPAADRAPLKGIHDYGDFLNVDGWLIEAKKRDRWDLPGWIRGVLKKVAQADSKNPGISRPWMILFAGDKRNGLPDMAALPTAVLFDLIRQAEAISFEAYTSRT